MVYGEVYEQWNDYGAEKVMLFIALHTGQAHPYSWQERVPEPDPTGHTLLAGCLRGAASGGAGCFVDVLSAIRKTNSICAHGSDVELQQLEVV